tara:strand:+ start:86 stop:271 length:186 start_codon:yes stop_codon:yes gene_type:complete
MTLVIDNEQEEFVQQLAWEELNKLNINIDDFLNKNKEDDSKQREKTEKQLLQEEKQNVKNR